MFCLETLCARAVKIFGYMFYASSLSLPRYVQLIDEGGLGEFEGGEIAGLVEVLARTQLRAMSCRVAARI